MNWLLKLFRPCAHKWNTESRWAVNRNTDGKMVGLIVVLRCEHCGDVKHERIRTL